VRSQHRSQPCARAMPPLPPRVEERAAQLSAQRLEGPRHTLPPVHTLAAATLAAAALADAVAPQQSVTAASLPLCRRPPPAPAHTALHCPHCRPCPAPSAWPRWLHCLCLASAWPAPPPPPRSASPRSSPSPPPLRPATSQPSPPSPPSHPSPPSPPSPPRRLCRQPPLPLPLLLPPLPLCRLCRRRLCLCLCLRRHHRRPLDTLPPHTASTHCLCPASASALPRPLPASPLTNAARPVFAAFTLPYLTLHRLDKLRLDTLPRHTVLLCEVRRVSE